MLIDRHITKNIGDELIVAKQDGRQVFVLNAPGKFVWECLCESVPLIQIPNRMVEHFGIDQELAETDFGRMLTDWQAVGLLPLAATCHHYSMAGVSLSVHCASTKARQAILPIFAHLEGNAQLRALNQPVVDVEINETETGFEISSDAIAIGSPTNLDELLETVTSKFVDVVHDRSDKAISMHAAAIGDGRGCVLMPGQSGSGKSTLTAALVAAGYQYYTDDTVLLDDDYLAVPLPSPLVLKGKKWPSLSSILPDIAHLPIYRRMGNDVRYWSPPLENVAQVNVPVRAIIFPTFNADQAFEIEELNASQSLSRIISANCMIRRKINGPLLDGLVSWLESVPAYAMRHNNLDRSMEFVTKQLAP